MCVGFDRAIQVLLLNSPKQFVRVSDLFFSRCDERRQRGIRSRIVNEVRFHGVQYARRGSRGGTGQPRKIASGSTKVNRRTQKDVVGPRRPDKKTATETTREADTSSLD